MPPPQFTFADRAARRAANRDADQAADRAYRRARHKASGRGHLFRGAVALLPFLFLVIPIAAAGQAPTSSAPPQGQVQSGSSNSAWPLTGPNDTANENATQNNDQSGAANSLSQSAPLSADQIVSILEQNPDLLLELKSQLADRFQQQGMQVEAADISDQMVYNQVASSPALRATISQTLEERGYSADMGLASASSPASDSTSSDSESQLPLLAPNSSDRNIGPAAASSTSGQRSGIHRPGAANNPRGQERKRVHRRPFGPASTHAAQSAIHARSVLADSQWHDAS